MSVDGQDESPGGGAEVSRRVPGQDTPPAHTAGADAAPGIGLPTQRGRGALPPSDAELIVGMRDGDDTAYEELYRRHAEALRRYARTCCRDTHTADDLTAEVFARMLQAVRAGSGPRYAVRAYLLTTVRRVAATWAKSSRREQLVDDFAVFAAQSARLSKEPGTAPSPGGFGGDAEPGADVRALHEAEQSMARAAFRSLPERWQAVLWHTEVEEESPSQIATLFGLDANGARVLASRAREGLRQAYLQAHVSAALVADEECARYAGQLGTYARRRLRTRAEQGLRKHLEECARCRLAVTQIEEIANGIPAVVPVAVIGWFGATGYAKALALITGGAGTAAAGAAAGAGATGGAAGGVATAGGGSAGTGTGGAGALVKGLSAPWQAGIAAGVVAVAATVIALATVGHHAPVTDPEARPPAPRAVESRAATRSPQPPPTPTPKDTPAVPRPPATTPAPADTPASATEPVAVPVVDTPPPRPARTTPSATPSPTPTPTPSPTPSPTPTRPPSPAPSPPAAAVFWWNRLPYDVTADLLPDRGDRGGPVMRLRESSWVWRRWGMRIGDKRYGRGVTVQGASSVVIELNRPCSSFDALTGVDDLTAEPGEVRFSVFLDGVRAWQSPPAADGDPALPVHIGLTGHRTVRLVVEPRTRHGGQALVDWAQARFTCS
ncbi:sigma-70 family RNA polymerase sigma factor [Streptomyces sp. NPDC048664]|uniref:sigma-70 family RNA polymerase sigma factor n=1 Tax=Streptomyces sp. NPDC048664 TaxID=3154505 RepID=UPI00344AD8CF